MSDCWTEDPNGRPSFFHLVSTISDRLESIAGYLDVGSMLLSVGRSGILEYDHLSPGQMEMENEHLNPVVIISDEDAN
ncbi:hypothetical protein GBAR_LOCUS15737 [Geodia barretti]|uniref:Uncharacterized protein n=1 Tax=Geodia barretti TaxID=519541 RepID=A0AA35SF88_GEOBA|nr:hypothetical protein GBAR_LOCUS15737 [Geodia barretti]